MWPKGLETTQSVFFPVSVSIKLLRPYFNQQFRCDHC